MVFDLSKVTGIGDYVTSTESVSKDNEPPKSRTLCQKGNKAFLVDNGTTIEVRTDEELAKNLIEKYESVMWSRYFGRGGIEIVLAGQQLISDELNDLVRLSYNLT